jgi:hypothetical protein
MVQTLSNIPLYSGVNNEITNGLSFSELSVSQLKSATTNILINDTAPLSNQVLVAISSSNAMWKTGSATSSGDSFTQTSIKIADYIASANDEVLVDVNSASADVTISMPASPANGTQVRVILISQHNTRVCKLSRNGSNWKGVTTALIELYYNLVLNGDTLTLRFVNSTIGWIVLMDALQPHYAYMTLASGLSLVNAVDTNCAGNNVISDKASLCDTTNKLFKTRRTSYYNIDIEFFFNNGLNNLQGFLVYYNGLQTDLPNGVTTFWRGFTPLSPVEYGFFTKTNYFIPSNSNITWNIINNQGTGGGTITLSQIIHTVQEIR